MTTAPSSPDSERLTCCERGAALGVDVCPACRAASAAYSAAMRPTESPRTDEETFIAFKEDSPDAMTVVGATFARDLERECARLREALAIAESNLVEAAADIESWGAYASPYFQQKHDLAGCVADYVKRAALARAALAQPEEKT